MTERGNKLADWIAVGERVARLETDMHRLMGNGQPGVIDQILERVQRIERWHWIGYGLVVGAILLAGSGTISLKSLLEWLK